MREMVKKIRNKAADVWRKVLLPALLATFYMLSTTGTVAFAAGDTSAVTYSKYFLFVTFEAVTMALAIILSNAFINAGLPEFTGDYSDWAKTLGAYPGTARECILADILEDAVDEKYFLSREQMERMRSGMSVTRAISPYAS